MHHGMVAVVGGILAVALLLLLVPTPPVLADHKTQRYVDNDEVPVYVNIVGPYRNPTETYGYFEKLPFCRPEVVKHRAETLGEVLEGNRLASSGYDVHYKVDVTRSHLCEMSLTLNEIKKFKEAIDQMYYFQMIIDEIPVWNFIGVVTTEDSVQTHYLYTHLIFNIEYNKDRIVKANVTGVESSDSFVYLDSSVSTLPVLMMYSVRWTENTDIEFENRMDLFAETTFFQKELEIHWLSILNSVVLVVLLTGFLFIILMRVLKSDYNRYSALEEDPDEDIEEYGWKLIHGDVFRFPNHKMLLCAVLGIGTQFLVISICLLILGGVGLYYPYNRGSMKTSGVILYAFTCLIAGYVSGSFYKKIGGEKWAWNIVVTSTLFPIPLFIIWSILNSVAWWYLSTQALPWQTIIILFLLWLVVGFPLTVLGGIFGKNQAGPFDAPCRTRNIPREIPPAPWYHLLVFQMAMAGFLPFSAISIELYYIFATIWGHKLYTLYGILFLVFLILLIVTSFITIALAYFQLSFEDYHWWWRAVLNGGATSFFVYGYAIFFYVNRSSMSGLMQASFFFGYMILICFMFFLMLGSVGFFSALFFIRYIYKNFKTD